MINKEKIKHIVISRTDNIGDVILTLPIATILKEHFPDVKITFLAREYVRAVVEHCDHVDAFLSWDALSCASEMDAVAQIQAQSIDAVIHAFPKKIIAQLMKRAKIKYRIGTTRRLYHWLTCNERVNFTRAKSTLHEAQLNCQLLKPFQISSEYSLEMLRDKIALRCEETVPLHLQAAMDPNRFNLIVHPFTNGNTREWPVSHFISLIRQLPADRFNVILTGSKKESEIIEFIKKQKNIPWCASFDGEYDLGIWVLVKSIKEMNSFWKELLDKYLNYISKKSLTIFTKVSYFPRVYLLEGRNNDREYVFITEPEKANIDSKDIEILQLLAPNARIPLLEIAEKLNMTPKTVASRIKELQRKKVIIGYRTRFDLDKLSYQYFKLHINLHNITKEKEDNLRNYFFTHPNIIYDNRVLGGDDIEIEIQVKSLQDLRKIIADIKSSFSDIIQDYHYFLIYKEHKALFLVSDV